MTEILNHEPHLKTQSNHRQTPTQLRAKTERVLCDLAFVLKMTELVRGEMEAERAVRKPVTVR
ncbi:MAG: hypothetical protein EXR98_08820 [Gemmataceae bacterium]|nr:hypothetical protein [Gemmataceae bacterium]